MKMRRYVMMLVPVVLICLPLFLGLVYVLISWKILVSMVMFCVSDGLFEVL
jgi:hypothetical protein